MFLGIHSSISDLGSTSWLESSQVFLHSPLHSNFTSPSVASMKALHRFSEGKRLVVHAPYVLSIYGDGFYRWISWLSMCRYLLEELPVPEGYRIPIVIHSNKCKSLSQDKVYEAFSVAMDGVAEMKPYKKTVVCIETDAHPNTLPVRTLFEMADQKGVNLCVDTEHVYASGTSLLDLSTSMEKYPDVVKCIHLNPIPNNVKFGSGLDRHNHVNIIDCQHRDDLFSFYRRFKGLEVPAILERGFFPEQDLEELKRI